MDSEKPTDNGEANVPEVVAEAAPEKPAARPRQPVDIVASQDAQVSFRSIKKGSAPMPKEDKGNEEFPVPCKTFLASLVDTENHVWAHWLNRNHGRENHKPQEWATILKAHKDGTHSSLNS